MTKISILAAIFLAAALQGCSYAPKTRSVTKAELPASVVERIDAYFPSSDVLSASQRTSEQSRYVDYQLRIASPRLGEADVYIPEDGSQILIVPDTDEDDGR